LLFGMMFHPRRGLTALAILLCFAAVSTAQDAKVSFPAAPFSDASATPLFRVDIAESPKQPPPAMPSLTVVKTQLGPRLQTVTLKLPVVTVAGTAIAPRLGDQALPRTFTSSPWAGNGVKRPMRGLSFSTAGATPVSVLFGELDAGSRPVAQPGTTPGVAALAVEVTPRHEFSVTPRALVPLSSKTTQATVGTAIRADVNRHVSFVSDVGAAGTPHDGWEPLAAASVISHWRGTELETNLLRGTSPGGAADVATVGSLDREIVRGLVRSIPGTTISAQASWSRPASAEGSAESTVGSIGVAYDRLPIGVLTAARQDEDGLLRRVDTTRIEWRRRPVGGVVVRYTEREQTPRDRDLPEAVSKEVELELPGWIERDVRNRVDVRAVLSQSPLPGPPTLSSRLSGRFDVVDEVGVSGDTELGILGSGPTLRALRVTSTVPVRDRTAVQLIYTYQAHGLFVFNDHSFEARLSRAIPLVNW
jgi:hypothetical protein